MPPACDARLQRPPATLAGAARWQALELKAAGVKESATLVDFLVETLGAHLPHLLALPSELRAVLGARRLDYDFLRAEMERLGATVEAVEAEVRYAKLRARAGVRAHLSLAVADGGRVVASVHTDALERKLAPFCEAARRALAELRAAHAEVQAIFPEVLLYFGESPDSCSLNELVQGTARFVSEFEAARDKLEERKAKGGSLLVPLPAPSAAPDGADAAGGGFERRRAGPSGAAAPAASVSSDALKQTV